MLQLLKLLVRCMIHRKCKKEVSILNIVCVKGEITSNWLGFNENENCLTFTFFILIIYFSVTKRQSISPIVLADSKLLASETSLSCHGSEQFHWDHKTTYCFKNSFTILSIWIFATIHTVDIKMAFISHDFKMITDILIPEHHQLLFYSLLIYLVFFINLLHCKLISAVSSHSIRKFLHFLTI